LGSGDQVTLVEEIASIAASGADLAAFEQGVLDRLQAYWDGCEAHLLRVSSSGMLVVPGEELPTDVAGGPGSVAERWLLREVVQQQKPRRLNDVPPGGKSDDQSSEFKSALAVPLKSGDRVIGVLSAISEEVAAFDETDENTMMLLAPLVALALENRRLTHEAKRSAEELQVFRRLTNEVILSSDSDHMLDSVVTYLTDAIGCRGCSIALMDRARDVLCIRAAVGISAEWQRDFELKLGEGVAGRVARDGRPEYVADAFGLDDFIFFDPAVRSLLTVPIRSGNRIIGTLSVDSSTPDAFSATDEALLCVVAPLVGSLLENQRLRIELGKRDDDLQDAYTELAVVARSKDEMVQNVSHELRTPLTFVKGYVDLMLVEEVGTLNQDQRRFLEIVARKTTQLIGRIRDLIFLQQLDYMPLVRKSVSLLELIRQVQIAVREQAERAGVTIVTDVPSGAWLVAGDEVALLEVLEHLLDNAVKFSPQGGVVALRAEDVGAMVKVSVSDQGIGIPIDLQKLIFEPFYQIDSSANRQYAGCGIGLSIARRIVEGHGGELGLVSEAGAGSTFFFTLPKHNVPVLSDGTGLASTGPSNIPH